MCRPLVGTGRDGPDGADDPDPTVAGGPHRRRDSWFDDTDDRDGEPVAEAVERRSGGAVARHDHEPGTSLHEEIADLERVPANFVRRLRTVREATGITEVEHRFVGQQVDQRPEHREPAEPGVEDPER